LQLESSTKNFEIFACCVFQTKKSHMINLIFCLVFASTDILVTNSTIIEEQPISLKDENFEEISITNTESAGKEEIKNSTETVTAEILIDVENKTSSVNIAVNDTVNFNSTVANMEEIEKAPSNILELDSTSINSQKSEDKKGETKEETKENEVEVVEKLEDSIQASNVTQNVLSSEESDTVVLDEVKTESDSPDSSEKCVKNDLEFFEQTTSNVDESVKLDKLGESEKLEQKEILTPDISPPDHSLESEKTQSEILVPENVTPHNQTDTSNIDTASPLPESVESAEETVPVPVPERKPTIPDTSEDVQFELTDDEPVEKDRDNGYIYRTLLLILITILSGALIKSLVFSATRNKESQPIKISIEPPPAFILEMEKHFKQTSSFVAQFQTAMNLYKFEQNRSSEEITNKISALIGLLRQRNADEDDMIALEQAVRNQQFNNPDNCSTNSG
jgi:hypothetical protein